MRVIFFIVLVASFSLLAYPYAEAVVLGAVFMRDRLLYFNDY